MDHCGEGRVLPESANRFGRRLLDSPNPRVFGLVSYLKRMRCFSFYANTLLGKVNEEFRNASATCQEESSSRKKQDIWSRFNGAVNLPGNANMPLSRAETDTARPE